MASRQDELQAKRARLIELKRLREVRDQNPGKWRQSIGTASNVRPLSYLDQAYPLTRP